jgi:hypothetical protein
LNVQEFVRTLVIKALSGKSSLLIALYAYVNGMSVDDKIKYVIRTFRQKLSSSTLSVLEAERLASMFIPIVVIGVEPLTAIHKKRDDIYICRICGSFIDRENFENHVIRKHEDLIERYTELVIQTFRKIVNDEELFRRLREQSLPKLEKIVSSDEELKKIFMKTFEERIKWILG